MTKVLQFDVGFAVTVLRQAQGKTQAQLAQRAGTTRQVVSNIEIGTKQPTIASVRKLAKGLEVKPQTLIRLAEVRRKAA